MRLLEHMLVYILLFLSLVLRLAHLLHARAVAHIASLQRVERVVILAQLFLELQAALLELLFLGLQIGDLNRLMLHHLAHLSDLLLAARQRVGYILRLSRLELRCRRCEAHLALVLAVLRLKLLAQLRLRCKLLAELLAVFGDLREHCACLLHRRG